MGELMHDATNPWHSQIQSFSHPSLKVCAHPAEKTNGTINQIKLITCNANFLGGAIALNALIIATAFVC